MLVRLAGGIFDRRRFSLLAWICFAVRFLCIDFLYVITYVWWDFKNGESRKLAYTRMPRSVWASSHEGDHGAEQM
jgi:hypothetical protein